MSKYQICQRCVMDISATEIVFFDDGRCSFCKDFDDRVALEIHNDLPENFLVNFADQVKSRGSGREYDCLIGISGGVDSSYVAYLTRNLGLRPLAIHLDNGWNSELATANIENLCEKLDIDLETTVLDWREFRDIQRSFLQSSISNIEIPTDHAIWAILIKTAAKYGIKYIISGSNAANESIMPNSWLYGSKDSKIIKSIHKKFGSLPMRTFPYLTIFDYFDKLFLRRIKWIPILNYLNFNKKQAKAFLMKEYNWRDYGGKHYESIFTRFFHSYYLVEKFGYDLRRAYLSSEICSGQITRDEAINELASPPADPDMIKTDLDYVKKKLKFSDSEFHEIMVRKNLTHEAYGNNSKIWSYLKKYVQYFRKVITEI